MKFFILLEFLTWSWSKVRSIIYYWDEINLSNKLYSQERIWKSPDTKDMCKW